MGTFVDTSMKSKVLFIDALNKKPPYVDLYIRWCKQVGKKEY